MLVSAQNTHTHAHTRAGTEQLASLSLPTRRQEPYRYSDLESLYRTDFVTAPALEDAGKSAAAAAEEVGKYFLDESKGQQLVFVNGVFSAALSDVSKLGGVEGLVAGNLGQLEGDQLAEVRLSVLFCRT